MPIVSIPTKAQEWLVKHAGRESSVCDEVRCFSLREIHKAQEEGFFAALRIWLPSEVVGLLVMDADEAREGRPPFTDGLPALRFDQ